MPTITTRAGKIGYSWNGVAASTEGLAPLIFIHGAGGLAKDWPAEWRYRMNAAQTLGIRAMPKTHSLNARPVYAIDLPGHGASGPRPDDALSVAAQADAIMSFAEAQGLVKPVLCGHSLGGAIAITAAINTPEQVGGLIVVGSAARIPVSDQILDGLKTSFEDTVDMIIKFSWPKGALTVFREIARRRMKTAGAEIVHGDFAMCADYDARERVSEIACPTLVLAGALDKMVRPEASEKLLSAIPSATFETIDGGGHFFHLDCSGATGLAIDRFMPTCDAARI